MKKMNLKKKNSKNNKRTKVLIAGFVSLSVLLTASVGIFVTNKYIRQNNFNNLTKNDYSPKISYEQTNNSFVLKIDNYNKNYQYKLFIKSNSEDKQIKNLIDREINLNLDSEGKVDLTDKIVEPNTIMEIDQYGTTNVYYYKKWDKKSNYFIDSKEDGISLLVTCYDDKNNFSSSNVLTTKFTSEMLYNYKVKSMKSLYNLTFINDIDHTKNTSSKREHIVGNVERYVAKDFDYFDHNLGQEKLFYEYFKFINYIEFDIKKYIGMEIITEISNNKFWKYNDSKVSLDIDLIKNSTAARGNNISYTNGPGDFGIAIIGTSKGNFTENQRPYVLRVIIHEIYHIISYYIDEKINSIYWEYLENDKTYDYHFKYSDHLSPTLKDFMALNPRVEGNGTFPEWSYYGTNDENIIANNIAIVDPKNKDYQNQNRSWITRYSMRIVREDMAETFAGMTLEVNNYLNKEKFPYWNTGKTIYKKANVISDQIFNSFDCGQQLKEKENSLGWMQYKKK